MRKYLEKRLAKLIAKRDSLATRAAETQDINELRSINTQIDEINDDIRDINEQIADIDARGGEPEAVPTPTPAGANMVTTPATERGFNPLARYSAPAAAPATTDVYNSNEYRKAFMEHVCRGTAIPAEMRATTTTTDMSVVIPTTLMNEIIQKLDTYGSIWAKVRKLNIQGGVEIPILSLKPEATWISETQSSADKKLQINQSISFSYFGIECKIAQTIFVNVLILDQFEKLFTQLAVEAVIRKVEEGVVKGTGTGQMTGVTVDTRVPAANVIEMTEAEFGDWAKWKKLVFAKMKKAYRRGEFIMAQSSFDAHIDAMVDKQGQPIGRVNYGIDGGETYRFGGKVVETVEEDIIADFDSAAAGDVVAIFINLSDYGVNTNMQMTTTRWVDNDTNEIKNKVLMILDGKLIDPNGVLIIKKKASA